MRLTLEDLRFRYPGDGAWVVDGVSLDIAEGEFFTLLGPSGCGKTTLLWIVAGFLRAASGRLLFDGADVGAQPPERRGVGIVFQNYALFPHLTVRENVAFGLRGRGAGGADPSRRVAEMLELVAMGAFADRRPGELSGGQQQRVALARALAPRPRALLMDEPLSNLDAALRVETRERFRALQREVGITTLYVTHDQEEALASSDRLAVLRAGRVRQVGTPEDVYDAPATADTAAFLGRCNLLPVRAGGAGGGSGAAPPLVVEGIGELPPSIGGAEDARAVPPSEGGAARCVLAVRPERLRFADGAPLPASDGEVVSFDATVAVVEFLGERRLVRCRVDGLADLMDVVVPHAGGEAPPPRVGERRRLHFRAADARLVRCDDAS